MLGLLCNFFFFSSLNNFYGFPYFEENFAGIIVGLKFCMSGRDVVWYSDSPIRFRVRYWPQSDRPAHLA